MLNYKKKYKKYLKKENYKVHKRKTLRYRNYSSKKKFNNISNNNINIKYNISFYEYMSVSYSISQKTKKL